MLTHDRLREVLHYEPETGVFMWRLQLSWRGRIGNVAGCLCGTGRKYREIRIDGGRFWAHRLAWFYVSGKWPAQQIDHINLNKDDNRLVNLREATKSQNQANVPIRAHNTSGLKGVCYNASCHKWKAQIAVSKKKMSLGHFNTREEGHAAYVAAAVKYFGEFSRAA